MDADSPEPTAPAGMRAGWASMPHPTNMDPGMHAGSVVQDLLGALGRIEQRLERIEDHLGIKPGKARATARRESAGRSRAPDRAATRARKTRTSPYQ